jgi:uncharacterized membrane protein YccC
MDALTRQSVATAIGVVAAIFAALSAGLDEPYWAGISALVIANVDRSALFTKGVLRIAGTVVGVVSGYCSALLLEGNPVAQAIVLMLAAGLGTYARVRSAYGYAWFYASLSFILVLACSMTTPAQLYLFAHFRCYEIVIGVVCATVADWAFGRRAGEFPAGIGAGTATASHSEALRVSVAAAVGALWILLAWSSFNLPAFTQVFASSLVIIDSNFAAARHRGLQRISGCLVGGGAGLAMIGIDPANIVWWVLSLAGGVFLFSRIHLGGGANAYVGTQAAVAYLLTLVGSGPPLSIMPPLDRLTGILIGVGLMSIVLWVSDHGRDLFQAACRPRSQATGA